MKIALVQLHAKDKLWHSSAIPQLLSLVHDVDLVVFPECMPFDNDSVLPIMEAETCLANLTLNHAMPAFIAGGYVLEDGVERNAVFLSHAGRIGGRYFKRLPWQEPQIAPGGETVVFRWGTHACIPLICADAANNPSPIGTRMMYEAIRHGAGMSIPIIVSSYGSELNTEYWQAPLQTWALGCGAPVLICGVSGKGAPYIEEDGNTGNYGGGGSGVFWPDDRLPWQRKPRGIYVVDISTGTVDARKIPVSN